MAGVPCGAIRSGFVGEVCFELHHPRSRGPELWAALVRRGAAFGLRPHGLDALEILRLEKGHLYVGQDTLPGRHAGEARPRVGRGSRGERSRPSRALERLAEMPLDRPEARRPRVRSRRRGAPRRAAADRRADPREGDLGGMEPDPRALDRARAGSAGNPDGGFPDALHADRVTGPRRPHAVPRPGGGAPPWLSSGPSTRPRRPATSRCVRRARAGWPRTRCSCAGSIADDLRAAVQTVDPDALIRESTEGWADDRARGRRRARRLRPAVGPPAPGRGRLRPGGCRARRRPGLRGGRRAPSLRPRPLGRVPRVDRSRGPGR